LADHSSFLEAPAYLAWFLNHGSHPPAALHYDSLEMTAETFPTTSFRNYLAINHSKHRSRQKIQHLSQPTCWNDLVMVGHEICRLPVKALFACRRSPSLLFAANVQVTTITLLPLQHSHLEPSFSTFSNLPCPPCKQLACIAATLTTCSFPFTRFLNICLSP
jgi:hypothetical protein